MAKRIAACRSRVLKYHFDRHQAIEVDLQFQLGAIAGRRNELRRELAAERRGDLCGLLG